MCVYVKLAFKSSIGMEIYPSYPPKSQLLGGFFILQKSTKNENKNFLIPFDATSIKFEQKPDNWNRRNNTFILLPFPKTGGWDGQKNFNDKCQHFNHFTHTSNKKYLQPSH